MSNVSGCGCGSSTPAVSSDCNTDPCKKPCESAPKDCSPCPPKDCYQTETIGGIEFIKLPGGVVALGNENDGDKNPRHCATIRPISVARTEVTNAQMDCYIREMGSKTHAKLYQDKNGKIHVGERGTKSDLECNCSDVPPDSSLICGGMNYLGIYRVVPDAKRTGQKTSGVHGTFPQVSDSVFLPNHPAVLISWHESLGFLDYMSKKTGREFRFLTPDEWAYAAKGGQENLKYTGDRYHQISTLRYGHTINPYGIYDVSDNVWEWTSGMSGYCDSKYSLLRGVYSYDNSSPTLLVDPGERDHGVDEGFRYYFTGLRVAVEP